MVSLFLGERSIGPFRGPGGSGKRGKESVTPTLRRRSHREDGVPVPGVSPRRRSGVMVSSEGRGSNRKKRRNRTSVTSDSVKRFCT